MNVLRLFTGLNNEGSFEETWEKIVQVVYELLNPAWNNYENLNLTSNDLERIRLMVLAVFAAIVIASVYTAFNRSIYSKLVEAINGAGAWNPASAKTLKELGCERNGAIRHALVRGRAYSGLVRCVEEEIYEAEYERKRREFLIQAAASDEKSAVFKEPRFIYDFDYVRFYIPEDKAFEAEARFQKKGNSFWLLLLIVPISLILLIVALHYMPDVLQLIDNFLGGLNA